jgi:hypothetical protein
MTTFERWKNRAQQHATGLGLPDDIWATDDPYDLLTVALEAYAKEQSPTAFIEEIFADDIASREHDEEMRRQAEERATEE